MLPELAFILAAVAVISLVEVLAEKSRLPAAALLTIAGLCYALLPGPNLALNPEFILTFILPPLLYSAALNSSLLAIRRNLRPVISLSVVLVLVTALVVGVGTDLLIPGVTLAAGTALGAAVAPPDPVAALAIGRRAGLPPRLITLIEGEGLLNDATALTLFTVAAVAATSGNFSPGGAVGRFVLAAAGGFAVGAVTAGAVRLLRRFVHGPIVLNSLSLATPFAAYLLGQEAHVSGVLAVVVTGLIVGHDTPRRSSGASRLQTAAVWRLADFLLEGFVFLLIGQQLPAVIRGLRDYPTTTILAAGCLTVGIVLVLRPAWLIGTQALPRAAAAAARGAGPRRPAAAQRARDHRAELGRDPRRHQPGRDLQPPPGHRGGRALPRPGPADLLHLPGRARHPARPGPDVRRAGPRPGPARRLRRPGPDPERGPHRRGHRRAAPARRAGRRGR